VAVVAGLLVIRVLRVSARRALGEAS
jgi:hypothetical protein